MRKRRILSLLLAVAVMATMLVAVPLTASANYSDTGSLITWDFGEYSTQNDLSTNVDYHDLTLVGNGSNAASDYVSSAGFHTNGTSSASSRHIIYTPKFDGTLTVEYKSNNNSATDRWTAIGTSVVTDTTVPDNPAIIASGYTQGSTLKTISGELKASTKYYIYCGNGGQTITKLTYEYQSGPDIKLDKEEITLPPNGNDTLTAELVNTTAQDNKITWSIAPERSNKGTISIGDSNDGKTTINIDAAEAQPGDSAAITAKVTGTDFPEPGVSKTCTVRVANIPQSIKINEENPYVYVGKTTSLTTTVEPADAVYELIWSVDKNATVDNGTVTGGTKGTAKVTVKVKDHEDVTASVDVDVRNIPRVDGVDANNITRFQNNNFKEHAESIVDDLTAAATTKIYDILGEAAKKGYAVSETALNGESPYEDGKLYFDKEVAVVGSSNPIYQNNKSTTNIDGSTQTGGIRVKNRQDVFALKLAAGSTVRVNIHGGGSGRYGIISSTAGNYSTVIGGETLACEDVSSKNALVEYTNNTKAEQVIYIAASDNNEQKPGGDSFISQIQVIVPPEKGVADSGWYGEAENPNGVIRFLQIFDEETVEEMGIYIVDGADGGIVDTKKISTEDGATIEKLAEAGGFYADIYGISKTSDQETTFYAVPFVKLTGGIVIKAETIDAKVDWDREVEYTPGN